ncbi:tripartite motif-containing protein 2-like [Actinia tenebrosa]|uniref:Tripartite motif-containing protein 2-like n=1 Tax=Actinia tenebrosa TaxID=6105 RepID=A0A6P8J4A8_ACTTE|nr:tripartite motif-containing protein 2-like [Actinia tenebrosa]
MAGHLNPFITKLKKDLTCTICKRFFNGPTTLSCLHSFCSKCLIDWNKTCKEGRQRFSCPICKKPIDGSGIDMSKPRISFYLESLITLVSSIEGKSKQGSQPPECKCCALDHKSHNKVSILEETKSIKQTLRQDMKELNKVVEKYNQEKEKIRESMATIQSHFESAKKSVRGVAETAFKLIMDHENEMIKVLNEKERMQKSECLRLQGKINSELQNVSEIQLQYQCLLENDVSLEIIEKQNFLQKKCNTILDKEAMLQKKPMLKRGNVTVDYVTNPEVMQSLQNIGKLVETKPLDPSRCTIEALKEVRNGYFNELEFEIVTRDCDGEVCCVTGNFEIRIIDQEGDEIEKNAAISEEKGKYRAVVTYRAEKKSPCEIQVNIGGKRIKNSPQIVNMK